MENKTEFGHPTFFINPDYKIEKLSKNLMQKLQAEDASTFIGRSCHRLFFNLDHPCRLCPVAHAVTFKTSIEQDIKKTDQPDSEPARHAVATPVLEKDGSIRHLIIDCLGHEINMFMDGENLASGVGAVEKLQNRTNERKSVLLDRDLSVILYNQGVKSILPENTDTIGRNVFAAIPYYNRPEIRNPIEDLIFHRAKTILYFETDDSAFGNGQTQHRAEKLIGNSSLDAVFLSSRPLDAGEPRDREQIKAHIRILSQFSSRMAHDIKNDLALISTNTEFILQDAADSPEIVACAEKIRERIKRIVEIVEYANSLKVHNWEQTTECNLPQLLNRVITVLQLSKPFSNHDVQIKATDGLPNIVTSEFYLERALTELIKVVLLNSEDKDDLLILLDYEREEDAIRITFKCRQHKDIYRDLEAQLTQFYISKQAADSVVVSLLIAYATLLIQNGSLTSRIADKEEHQIDVKLPRVVYVA